MARLYLVPTPIGNMDDITLRAVKVLSSVDVILAEDTRTSQVLLKHLGIEKKMWSHHKFNEHAAVEAVAQTIVGGQNVALISDAGTPGISDPGFLLVRTCVEAGIEVETLPGATALIPALVQSGFPCDRFCFEGFLPQKKGRAKQLQSLAAEERTMIFYEAPHKIGATLRDLAAALGDREIAIVREITKIHEEVIRTTLCAAAEKYADGGLKGEIVLIIAGAKPEEKEQMAVEQAVEEAKKFIASGDSASEAAKKAAKLSGHKKGDIYKLLQGEKDNG